jgi:hypothetical protein
MLETVKELLKNYWGFSDNKLLIKKEIRSFFRDSEIVNIEYNKKKYILKVTPSKLENLIKKNYQIAKTTKQFGTPVLLPIKEPIKKNNYTYELYPKLTPLDVEDTNLQNTNIIEMFIGLQNTKIDNLQTFINNIIIENTKHQNYIKKYLEKYFPYLETSFIHGDLHPHNLFSDGNKLFLSDWETASTGPKLYDLAFFCGCIGLHGKEHLKSNNILFILNTLSDQLYIDPLSIDTFQALIVFSRLNWLNVWENNKDIEMIESELNYLDYLIDNHDSLQSIWKENLVSNLSHSTKWIITDANFSKETLSLKNTNNLQSLPIDYLSSQLPQLIIAFGKEGNIYKNIELLELHKEITIQEKDIANLLISFINFSLDCARLKQRKALEYIIEQIETNYNYSSFSPICLAYLYRNYFTLLTEIDDTNTLELIKSKFTKLLENNTHNLAIIEEYSRILSGEISYFLRQNQRTKAKTNLDKLKELSSSYPSSSKIQGAYRVGAGCLKG